MKTFDEYQRAAARTMNTTDDELRNPEKRLAIFGLGVAGETGEVVEMIKKHIGHGHELDLQKLTKELGDVLWYLSAICTVCGLELESVAKENIAKLHRRYPDGFSYEASQARVDLASTGRTAQDESQAE